MTTRGLTQNILRWPILVVVCLIILVEVILYFLLRFIVWLYERITALCKPYRKLISCLDEARDFDTWCTIARELDRVEGRDK
jgi:hypothetical protein